jgi:hypothetical protein
MKTKQEAIKELTELRNSFNDSSDNTPEEQFDDAITGVLSEAIEIVKQIDNSSNQSDSVNGDNKPGTRNEQRVIASPVVNFSLDCTTCQKHAGVNTGAGTAVTTTSARENISSGKIESPLAEQMRKEGHYVNSVRNLMYIAGSCFKEDPLLWTFAFSALFFAACVLFSEIFFSK